MTIIKIYALNPTLVLYDRFRCDSVSKVQPEPACTGITVGTCIGAAVAAPPQKVAVGPIGIPKLIGGIWLLLSDRHGVLIAWPDPSGGNNALAKSVRL